MTDLGQNSVDIFLFSINNNMVACFYAFRNLTCEYAYRRYKTYAHTYTHTDKQAQGRAHAHTLQSNDTNYK